MPESKAPEKPDFEIAECDKLDRIVSGSIEDALLEGLRVDQPIRSATRCVLRTCDFKNSTLAGARLRDCVFDRCDLSNVDLSGSSLTRVVFQGCKAVGVDLSEVAATSLDVRSTGLKLATLICAKLDRCRFTDSDLAEADFDGAKLEHVTFKDSRLAAARFPRARLTAIDLRGSDLAGVLFEPAALPSLTIEPAQAAELLRAMGARVER